MHPHSISRLPQLASLSLLLGFVATALPTQTTPPGGQSGQPPAGGMFAPPQGLPAKRVVHITGENPGLQLRERANGPIVADYNYWRVAWSPYGSGHVCYLPTGTGSGPGDIRVVLTDNPKLAEYVTHETMARLVPDFAEPAYRVIAATFKSEGDAVNEQTEHCISDEYRVSATWRQLTPGQFGGMEPGNGFFMNFIINTAGYGEIVVNGERLPGQVLPGPGRPPAYLAFAETWLK